MSGSISARLSITPWFGKVFPNDCLQYPDLELYCDQLRAIPPQCPVNYNLNAHLPIQHFLHSVFPSHNHSLVVEAAKECFSSNPPTEILTSLIERDIPSHKFIQDLKSQFGQAVLDRQRSIKDPLYDKSLLPFWVLTLWERLAELNAAKGEWTSAQTWLHQPSHGLDSTTLAAAERHFTRIGWCADITIGQERATTLSFCQLLADGRLDSTVLDLMAECIQTEVTYNGPTSVRVCGTIFTNKLEQLGKTREQPPDWFRERFIDPVQDLRWQTLYFPMFWPRHKHWVSVKVNFDTGFISIGRLFHSR